MGALCVLDVKNTAKNLLKTVKSFVKLDDKCEDASSRKCVSKALKAAVQWRAWASIWLRPLATAHRQTKCPMMQNVLRRASCLRIILSRLLRLVSKFPRHALRKKKRLQKWSLRRSRLLGSAFMRR